MCKIVLLIEITAFYEMTVGNVSLPAFTNIQTHTHTHTEAKKHKTYNELTESVVLS